MIKNQHYLEEHFFAFFKHVFALLFLTFTILSVYAQDSLVYKGISIWNGDLLFVGAQQQHLSAAINRVTQLSKTASFDHVGIIQIEHGAAYILHASSIKGTVKEPLDSIIQGKEERFFAIYRIKDIYQKSISQALNKANKMLGKPYNSTYILNDSSYYCSDFIERIFRGDNLFKLEPMTFKNPKTGNFDFFWIDFYKKLEMEIPEGKLGCNPNGMAASLNIHLSVSFKTKSDSIIMDL